MIEGEKLKYVIEALTSKEKYKEAYAVLDFFEEQVDSLEDYDTLGAIAMDAKYLDLRLKCALYTYTHCLTGEQLFAARENLYKCYNALNYPEMALQYVEANIKLKPNDTDSLLNKAFNLSLMNKKDEAEILIDYVLENDKEGIEDLDFTQSVKLLKQGDIKRGVLGFMGAKKKPKNTLFEGVLKFWDGGVYPGKTIVVNAEGGVGDEFINLRFLNNLKALGMHPIIYSSWHVHRPDTVNLYRRHGYEVTTNHFFFTKDMLWTHMMCLPSYLGLKESQLWTGPYLTPLRQEKNNLGDKKKLRIGIKCDGNPYFEQDIYRTIPTEKMIEYLPNDADIFYFDKEKIQFGTTSLKERLNSWEDTIDFIDQMDVIVSSCTSIVHAAGAMGKKTIVIVPIAKYYIWETTRTDNTTPWYGKNFTVLAQTKVRSWDEPLSLVKDYLKNVQ